MVPWYPGGHADPWNHTEALMALMLGGHRAAAERGFDWLQSLQRPDGAWHQYYLADGVEEDKLDANCVAYVAAGVWFHWLHLSRPGRPRGHVADGARRDRLRARPAEPRGEIIWARHADATPFTLRAADRVLVDLPQPALLDRDRARSSVTSGPTGSSAPAGCTRVIRDDPDAFAPKHRWAMDWYYPVLCGIVTGDAGRARLEHRREAFTLDEWGVRCVSDRPWITAAETCECAIAHLAVGERGHRPQLFSWAQRLRTEGDRYWTGIVLPDEVNFPGGEQSTYTAAAVILAADALGGKSATANLFTDHEALPVVTHQHADPDHPGRA